jgi:hypothetical protein
VFVVPKLSRCCSLFLSPVIVCHCRRLFVRFLSLVSLISVGWFPSPCPHTPPLSPSLRLLRRSELHVLRMLTCLFLSFPGPLCGALITVRHQPLCCLLFRVCGVAEDKKPARMPQEKLGLECAHTTSKGNRIMQRSSLPSAVPAVGDKVIVLGRKVGFVRYVGSPPVREHVAQLTCH